MAGDTLSKLHSLHPNDALQSSSFSNNVQAVSQNEMYPTVAAMLKNLRPAGHDVDAEIAQLINDVKNDAANQAGDVTWSEVFAYKKGTLVGVGLMFFQVRQLCMHSL